MNPSRENKSAAPETEVPILARIWHEDEVWNVSAFDLPVVAYSDTFDAARANFSEAVTSHFKALEQFGKLVETVAELRTLSGSRTFWEDRVKPRETVESFRIPERFSIPAPSSTELSAA